MNEELSVVSGDLGLSFLNFGFWIQRIQEMPRACPVERHAPRQNKRSAGHVFEMPRAGPVECHVYYLTNQREAPRDKPVASSNSAADSFG